MLATVDPSEIVRLNDLTLTPGYWRTLYVPSDFWIACTMVTDGRLPAFAVPIDQPVDTPEIPTYPSELTCWPDH